MKCFAGKKERVKRKSRNKAALSFLPAKHFGFYNNLIFDNMIQTLSDNGSYMVVCQGIENGFSFPAVFH